MALVLDARIVQVPMPGGRQRFMRRTIDLMRLDDVPAQPLKPAEAKALGELLEAKLIRVSTAAPRTGRSRGHRMVFPTDEGRDWWAKGYRARRGCSNGNARGNAESRRRRRQWLIDTFGDGVTAPCFLASIVCTGPVTVDTVSVDRIVPGHLGGTYRRDNIRPACQPCQSHQGGKFGIEQARHREAGRRARQLTNA